MFDPNPFFKIPSDVEQEELAGGAQGFSGTIFPHTFNA